MKQEYFYPITGRTHALTTEQTRQLIDFFHKTDLSSVITKANREGKNIDAFHYPVTIINAFNAGKSADECAELIVAAKTKA